MHQFDVALRLSAETPAGWKTAGALVLLMEAPDADKVEDLVAEVSQYLPNLRLETVSVKPHNVNVSLQTSLSFEHFLALFLPSAGARSKRKRTLAPQS